MAAFLPILMGASYLLSKAGGGAAKERQTQNDYQLSADRAAQQGHQTDMTALLRALEMNESATMDRAKLGISAPRDRARQALLGSLLSNAQTARVTPPAGINMGTVSGGLDISQLLAGARGAGRELTSQATQALQTRSDIPAMTDATSRLKSAPTPSGYRRPGTMETLLSGGGLLGSLLGGVMQARGGGGQ